MAKHCPAARGVCMPASHGSARRAGRRWLNYRPAMRRFAGVVGEPEQQRMTFFQKIPWRRFGLFSLKRLWPAAVMLVAAPLAAADADDRQLAGTPVQARSAQSVSTVSLGGAVVPYREVTLAAQLPGRVEFLAGDEGDSFRSGAVLAVLDDEALVAQRQQVMAELANAEAALRNAGTQYQRELYSPYTARTPGGMQLPGLMDRLFTRPFSGFMGNGSIVDRHAELANRGTAIERGRNAIYLTQSRLREIDALLRDARSTAPFDGVIVSKLVEIGDAVQPGQALYKFADLKYLQLQVEVPTRFVNGLSKDQLLEARLDGGDAAIQVRVAQIFPVADIQRHAVTVKFDVPTRAPAAPGMYATVRVPDRQASTADTVLAPASAIVYRGSLPMVYVLHGDRYELRMVRVGERNGRDEIAVLSGLAVGEWVLDHPHRPGAEPQQSGSRGYAGGAAPRRQWRVFSPG